jgi:opacity protein-like surface antigen
MIKLKCYIFLSLFFLPYSLFASNPWTVDSIHHFEFSAAVGPNWAHSSSTDLVVSPFETDSVILNNISNHAIWKLGVGYHLFADRLQKRTFFNDLLIELNLYQSSETLNGNVWQYQLPQFNNFSFSSPITSTRIMLDVKPTLISLKHVSLYPILGFGNSWNNVPYNETVTSADVPADSNYLLNTSTNSNFAYDLGVGIRGELTEHLGVTLEYLYTNLGNMSSTEVSKNADPIITAPTFKIFNQSFLIGLSWKI